MTRASESAGLMLVLLSVSLWASVGVAVELAPNAPLHSPEFLAFARTFIGGAALSLLVPLILGERSLRTDVKHLPDLFRFAIGNAVFQVGFFYCLEFMGVALTAFLTGCLPPVMAAALPCILLPIVFPSCLRPDRGWHATAARASRR